MGYRIKSGVTAPGPADPQAWDRARLARRFGEGPDLTRGATVDGGAASKVMGPASMVAGDPADSPRRRLPSRGAKNSAQGLARSPLTTTPSGLSVNGSPERCSLRPIAGPRYAYIGPLTWRAAWRWFIRPYLFALLCIAVIVSGLLILALW